MYVVHDRFMNHYLIGSGPLEPNRTFYISCATRFKSREAAWSYIKLHYTAKNYRFLEVLEL